MWLFIPVLVLALAGPVSVEDGVASIRNVTAQKSETVFVTVELTQTVIAAFVAIAVFIIKKKDKFIRQNAAPAF